MQSTPETLSSMFIPLMLQREMPLRLYAVGNMESPSLVELLQHVNTHWLSHRLFSGISIDFAGGHDMNWVNRAWDDPEESNPLLRIDPTLLELLRQLRDKQKNSKRRSEEQAKEAEQRVQREQMEQAMQTEHQEQMEQREKGERMQDEEQREHQEQMEQREEREQREQEDDFVLHLSHRYRCLTREDVMAMRTGIMDILTQDVKQEEQ